MDTRRPRGDRIVVVGSDCWARLYAHASNPVARLRQGDSRGRLLSAEERALLAANTAAFMQRMEQEAADASATESARAALDLSAWIRAGQRSASPAKG